MRRATRLLAVLLFAALPLAAQEIVVWPGGGGAGGAVLSVFGRTGSVTPIQGDYDSFFLTQAEADALYAAIGAGGGGVWGAITGTLASQTDLNTALGLKAALASPSFTGVPAAPTAAPGTNTTQLATTAFVAAAAGSGANTALSNLASVAINASLISDTANTDDLGSSAVPWRAGYFGTSLFLNTPTTADATADSIFSASATTKTPLIVQGKASQTAPLFEAQNSDGTVAVSFGAPVLISLATLASGSYVGGINLTNGVDVLRISSDNQYHNSIYSNNGLAFYSAAVTSFGGPSLGVASVIGDHNGLNLDRRSIKFARHAGQLTSVPVTIGPVYFGVDAHQNDEAPSVLTIYGQAAYPAATTNIVGGDVTITGGAGASSSAAAANGGRVALVGGTPYGTGVQGNVEITRPVIKNPGTKPTCAAAIRGMIWYDAAAGGAADAVEMCGKAAADTYSWVALATF